MTKVFVFDIESDGLLAEATKVHCGVVTQYGTKNTWSYRPHEIDQLLGKLSEADVLIGHNIIGYDLPLLKKLHGWEPSAKIVDTVLISRLQRPDRKLPPHAKDRRAGPHSLYAWGVRVGVDKPDYHEWEEFDEDMLVRCQEDVRINVLTFDALLEETAGQNWRSARLLTYELFQNLHKQEEYGWLVDKEYMERCISLLTKWIDRIDRAITPQLPIMTIVDETKAGGEYNYVRKPFKKDRSYTKQVVSWMESCGIDPDSKSVVGPFSRISYRRVSLDSNAETKDYLLASGWIPDEWNYKKDERGRPAKDENGQLIKTSPKLSGDDSFVGVSGKVGRLIAKRVVARHRRSNIEGWLKLIRPDGRIAARVSGVATTGRMKHAGLVNTPGGDAFFGKQMRRCFICKPGYKIVGTDAASCQDRALAARANSPEFTRMLLEGKKEDGTDGHSLAMNAINKVMDRNNLPRISRGKAKNFNYGWKFGASDNKLGQMCGGGINVGAQVREALVETFPAQGELIDRLTSEWKSNAKRRLNQWGKLEHYDGWISGLDGRPIRIMSEHQILVYMLQSDEAILMSRAYNSVFKWAEERGWKYGEDWGMVAWVHDEFQIEVKEEYAEEMAEMSARAIVEASEFYNMAVPQAGESDIGDSWLETH